MRAIAIVLARSSSKRIKNKNIIDFFNKPMLAYPIETALNSKLFEKVFISSDSMEYVNLAKNYGASFLNLRPKVLADDRTTTLEVMAYHMKELELKDEDIACCLYGVSVFLQEKHLKNACETLKQNQNTDYVFTCSPFSASPYRSFSLENGVQMAFKEHSNTRTQDLKTLYHDAGLLYMGKAQAFKEMRPIFSPNSIALELSPLEVQDIDTLEDLELAKLKYSRLKNACQ
ncbi:pseudaminic acid cytidylyltransferase [Helicobacter pylori]|uniref:pseudaminic acid cytidylyltransferase n=1 Tax=Helicobacter pylori TaxID=210 RepID=UPI0009A2CE7C|nr:pseudaminic acid cytidylyltransferase [Helicobacter pylori]KAA6513836.1 pseudaminic acid cytidylyltransferase [Helicobacter pylori]OPG60945.1 pseudaminic acid cytidylyltransferase [Helicobacter pylori]WRC49154.1 pseudaminic acid cytidylyltransferase [Helicobacter pylori]